MSDVVLVAYGGSPSGEAALDRALQIAQRDSLRLHVLSVADAIDIEGRTSANREIQRMVGQLEPLRARGRALNIDVSVQVAEGDVATLISRVAQEQHVRLIVIGHRHRGSFRRLVDASVAKRALDRAPCEVLVVGMECRASAPDRCALHA